MAKKAVIPKSRMGSRGRPEASRAAILQAAVREFSREGIGGARMDAIARAARVNKALLYYYFKDKDALYAAVLDQVFAGLAEVVHPPLTGNSSPSRKILAYAGAHFDYIASHPFYPRIVQGEMMRAGRGGTELLERLVKQYFRPLFSRVAAVLKEGIALGEFRPVNPAQVVPSLISLIVSYFTNAPAMRLMTGTDPLAPARIAARRAAVLDFISAALFQPSNQKPSNQKRKGASK